MGLTEGPFAAAYSHPQALGQTRRYLRERGIVPMAYADTAGAAAFVKEQGDAEACAIAPPIAAELYGLKIVAQDIEDAHDNTTRFVVLARKPLDAASLAGKPAMTTLVFEVKNVPAALYKALGGFATNGVNMTKLESYQKGASFAATMFFADIVGAPGDAGDRPGDRGAGVPLQGLADSRLLSARPGARLIRGANLPLTGWRVSLRR